MPLRKFVVILGMMAIAGSPARAASVQFAPKELFRIPFGTDRETLRAKIEDGNLTIPRDFNLDVAGHVYIYDTNNHRVVRYSPEGKFEMGINYIPTARQIFAHADSRQNLWLLISDPDQGMYFGVYDMRGKLLREGIFSRYNQYRLHVDDASTLHVILSSDKDPKAVQTFILSEESMLMKKEMVAPPPENHHQVRKKDRIFYVDQVPDASKDDSLHVNQVTDASHHKVADFKGTVIYVTDDGDIYTRVGAREIRVYDVDGSYKGKVQLTGLPSSWSTLRFDSAGNIYELDGIPDENDQYSAKMPGMRLIKYERR